MYLILVSELLGAGGEKIAKKLAEELKYDFFGKMELEKVAAGIGILSDIQKLDGSKIPSKFTRFFEEKPNINLARIQSVILEIAERCDAVFFVSGGKLLPYSFRKALHVLLTSTMERRIQRVIEEKEVDRVGAEKTINQSDYNGMRVVKYIFNEDWLSPHLYDLVLNTDRLGVKSAVKMVIQASESEAIKECSIETAKDLGGSLPDRIESALREAGVPNPNLLFTVQDTDSVRLHGIVYSLEEKERIERIVKGVEGIKKIANELAIFTGEE
jgi:cytidylate kinase